MSISSESATSHKILLNKYWGIISKYQADFYIDGHKEKKRGKVENIWEKGIVGLKKGNNIRWRKISWLSR